jgi:hypothetical protein
MVVHALKRLRQPVRNDPGIASPRRTVPQGRLQVAQDEILDEILGYQQPSLRDLFRRESIRWLLWTGHSANMSVSSNAFTQLTENVR